VCKIPNLDYTQGVKVRVMVFHANLKKKIQLYRGSQFYRWRKPEYPEIPTDLSQVTDKLYDIMFIEYTW